MRSPQTLNEADRRIVAGWAADCAERVLGLFEAEVPGDRRPRDAIARTRAFARGELDVAAEIRRRFIGGSAAREVGTPAAAAAAKAAGQAAAVPHMGAHAFGAAAYAAKAAGLAAPDRPEALNDEIEWQLSHMSPAVRSALRQLPPVGENRSGPLGPGRLASGLLGRIIGDLQASLAGPAPVQAHWLKAVGHARGPLPARWIEDGRTSALREGGFPRRPRVSEDDRFVLYASVWRRVFGVVVAVGEVYRVEHPRWPWRIAVEPLLVVPDLDLAPPVESIGVAARSMSQHSHIRLEPFHYTRAVQALSSIAL